MDSGLLRRRLIYALLLALATSAPSSAGAASLIEVRVADQTGGVLPPTTGVQPTGHGRDGWAGAVATDPGLAALRAAGMDVVVRIPDLAARERADRRADTAYAAQGASPLPSERSEYRRLADYEADMAQLVREHPGLVAPVALDPRTLEGRVIRGVEITSDVGEADGRPVMLMVGLHHAREWPSAELSMEFAFDLVQRFGTDPRVTGLLRRVRVIVVPIVNPDGFQASREAPIDPEDPTVGTVVGIPGNGTSYRRKNCRATGQSGPTQPASVCEANPGVDLNRNYGINWGSNGASTFEDAPDYRGAGPFSEPESDAVRRLVATRSVTMLITNHTFGNLVLRPPGVVSQGNVPDEPALKALGDRMAAANGYSSERSWELYDNSGTTEDWSYGVTGGYGYTFESNNENFHPAYERAVVGEYLGTGAAAGRGNREAFLLALEAAADTAGHAVLEGFAPPGRILRLTRDVASQTGPLCLSQPTGFFSMPCEATTAPLPFSDRLSVSREVGGDGVVEWHVNPSLSPLALRSGPWQLTCEDRTGRVLERKTLNLDRGSTTPIVLGCGVPPCRPDRALHSLAIRTGKSLRISVRKRPGARAARVRILRAVRGRLLGVTRPRLRKGRARWTPRRNGTYVVVVRARTAAGRADIRRRSVLVRGSRVRRGPLYARTTGCGELRVARLATPAFSRNGGRPRLLLRSPADVRATVTLRSRGRRIARRHVNLRAARTKRLALRRIRGRRVTVRITTVRGTPAARRKVSVTLRALGAR